MATGAGEAGKFATTSVIRRHISDPFAFDVAVEIDAAGSIYGIELYHREDYAPVVIYDLRRAVWFANGEMACANTVGLIATDVIARVPRDADCALEVAILREVEAVQALHTSSFFKGGRRHG